MTFLAEIHRLLTPDRSAKNGAATGREVAFDSKQSSADVMAMNKKFVNGKPIERPAGRSGKVRTRLLSECEDSTYQTQPFAQGGLSAETVRQPVGWLVVIEGPGTGDWFVLESGLTHLGRGKDQDVCLDFGDETISRKNHAFITYDISRHRFQLSHGESGNRTRLNGEVIDTTVSLAHGDCISVGRTTLRIAVFCDDGFQWPAIIDKGAAQ